MEENNKKLLRLIRRTGLISCIFFIMYGQAVNAANSGIEVISDGIPNYQESDGLVVMEMENTSSDLDLWTFKTSISNFTGNGYLEFNGNSSISGPATSPLEFKFTIKQAGLYYLHLHCARETLVINGETRTDVANDAYVRVEGDYNEGPNAGNSHGDDALLSLLTADTKFFGGNNNQFSWASGNRLDPGGHTNKRVAIYDFKAGETYKLTVSGRSKLFKINRLVFRHTSVSSNVAQSLSTPESSLVSVNLIPCRETFESAASGSSLGEEWQIFGSGEANIQSDEVAFGSNAAKLSGSISLKQEFANSEHDIVVTDFRVRPVPDSVGASPEVSTETAAAFFFDEAGALNILSGNIWQIAAGVSAVSLDEFHRISLFLNYQTQTYSVHLNEVPVEGEFTFANPRNQFGGIEFQSNSETPTYFDEFQVGVPLLFDDSFGTYTVGHSLDGLSEWMAAGVVGTSFQGDNFARLDRRGFIERLFVSTQSVVWSDFNIKATPFAIGESPELPNTTSSAIFFDETGQMHARNGSVWESIDVDPVDLNEFQRITVRMDYANQQYDLWLDNIRVSQGLQFANGNSSFHNFLVNNEHSQPTCLNTFAAVYDEPVYLDNDADLLPNSWERALGLNEEDDGSLDRMNGPTGDPDMDGRVNYWELVHGLDPLVSEQIDGANMMYSQNTDEVIFHIRESLSFSGNFVVQGSENLTQWDSITPIFAVIDPDIDGNGNSRLIEARIPRDKSAAFYRLASRQL